MRLCAIMDRIVIDGFGKFLGRDGATVVVKEKGSVVHRALPENLRQVIFSGKGSASTDAIELLAKHGVDVIFIDFLGNVTARLSPPILKTVETRREQYYAYNDRRSIHLSKEFVLSKLKNQKSLLGTLAKKRKDTDPETAEFAQSARNNIEDVINQISEMKGTKIDEVRERLMGFEANGSKLYWEAFGRIFGEEWGFKERSGRYAGDAINAMLNYGYGVLKGEVLRAVHFAGLDPYGGFLHADRSGRPSMVLDLMEEFRQQLIDKTVIKLVTKKQVRPEEFKIESGLCRLEDSARKLLLTEVLEKFEDYVRIEDTKIAWCNLILQQARSAASFLRRDTSEYRGFWLRW